MRTWTSDNRPRAPQSPREDALTPAYDLVDGWYPRASPEQVHDVTRELGQLSGPARIMVSVSASHTYNLISDITINAATRTHWCSFLEGCEW